MPSARHWPVTHLMLAWVAALPGLFLLRWALSAGVYEARLENQEVMRVAGHWSRAFASNVSLAVTVMTVVALLWVTVLWIAGRRDRARIRMAERIRHRRVLM